MGPYWEPYWILGLLVLVVFFFLMKWFIEAVTYISKNEINRMNRTEKETDPDADLFDGPLKSTKRFRFRIHGAHRFTGKEIHVDLVAEDPLDAEQQANEMNVMVESIEKL